MYVVSSERGGQFALGWRRVACGGSTRLQLEQNLEKAEEMRSVSRIRRWCTILEDLHIVLRLAINIRYLSLALPEHVKEQALARNRQSVLDKHF